MNTTKISENIQNTLKTYLEAYPPIVSIIHRISQKGGNVFLVGGAVRDLLLGVQIKDLDVEVHGVPLDDLQLLLKQFGPVVLVGKAFGVLRLAGLDVDWSIPRKDAVGRKPEVITDPFMDIKEAFLRRDLTINAMGINLVTFDLIDPFGGYNHLKQHILSTPDKNKFLEDPLRFYRVMQFISRFEMFPNEQLNEICKNMDISNVSVERIEIEFDKLMLKSKKPSLGIRWLQDIGRLRDVLPELHDTVDIPQEPSWHPEGGVFEHTMQCLDAAAVMEYDNDEDKLKVMYAVLCHDLGKAETTENIGGHWKSIGHSKVGVKLSKNMLSRITKRKELRDAVGKLVRYHMSPAQFVAANAKPPAYKRLAKKVDPEVTLDLLAKVALADKQGRNPIKGAPLTKHFPAIDKFLQIARNAKVQKLPEPPILLGRDLMGIVEPGPQMGELLHRAYEIQIERGIKDKETLKEIVLQEGETSD